MRTVFYLLLSLSLRGLLSAQAPLQYRIDLTAIRRDRIPVELTLPPLAVDTIHLCFPMTIPGTYARLDYGRYVKRLRAYDAQGERLRIERIGTNRFAIRSGGAAQRITYQYADTWDQGRRHHIFEPAGIGVEAGQYAALNGGMLGYLCGEADRPLTVRMVLPAGMRGYGSLPAQDSLGSHFEVADYHSWIDHPLLFTRQPAATLTAADTRVLIAAHNPHDDSAAFRAQATLRASMEAIAAFTGETTVPRYAYLLYFNHTPALNRIAARTERRGRWGWTDDLRWWLAGGHRHGYGALEHGTSSMYFLSDDDTPDYTADLPQVAIHEFMHIYTPLQLRDEQVAHFDFQAPEMSPHLWLYEGVTEYFAQLIQVRDSLMPLSRFRQTLRGYAYMDARYPDSVAFTEMSARVMEPAYQELYPYVYTRGALLALLLDLEIMRLTEGEQTLFGVIERLSQRYGQARPLPSDSVFRLFAAETHPALMDFFIRYVAGTEPLPIAEQLATVGLRYQASETKSRMVDFFSRRYNDLRVAQLPGEPLRYEVVKVGRKEWVGFEQGDVVDMQILRQAARDSTGQLLPEGAMITFPVERNDQTVMLSAAARYAEMTFPHVVNWVEEPSEAQLRMRRLWLGQRVAQSLRASR